MFEDVFYSLRDFIWAATMRRNALVPPAIWLSGLVCFWTSICLATDPIPDGGDLVADNVIQSFAVARDGDFLLIPVTIEGQQVDFVLDTGCTRTVFDLALSRYLTATDHSKSVNGLQRMLHVSPECHIGGNDVVFQGDVYCVDLEALRSHTGYNIRGLLGMDFLRHHIVAIDFDNGRVLLLRRLPTPEGDGIPFTFASKRRPTALVSICGSEDVRCLIDTGKLSNRGVAVESKMFEELISNEKVVPFANSAPLTTIDGTRETRSASDGRIQIGQFKVGGLSLLEDRETAIGLTFLSRFHVTFDFPQQTLYLKPGNRFHESDSTTSCGITLGIDGREMVVDSILESSLGDRAGIRKGDVLTSIDGKRSSEFTLFQAHRRLRGLRAPVILGLRRDGVHRSALLKPPK